MVEQYKIVKVNLNPVLGKEKGDYRPCVVISKTNFNFKTGLVWVLPITSRAKRFPTDVELTEQRLTTGIIDCGQLKSIDLSMRDFKVIETLNTNLISKIKERINKIQF